MDLTLLRQLAALNDLDQDAPPGRPSPGRSTLTSRLTPAPQIVFRVSDPATARALGESLSGRGPHLHREASSEGGHGPRDANGVAEGAEAAVDRAAGGAGLPLPDPLRARFESSLGADLSAVRVHTGSASAEANQAVGARAYTVGNDIHFGAGNYQPEDPFGMHLIAHEVAHTVQQSGASPARQHKLEVSTPHDALEHEADRAADAMVSGQAFAVAGQPTSLARSATRIARDYDGTGGGAGHQDGGASGNGAGTDASAGDSNGSTAVTDTGPPVPAGAMTMLPPAPVAWGGAPAIEASPAGSWSGSPGYKAEYAAPGNLDTYRAAFDASWSEAQGTFNKIVKVSSAIRTTEGELPPILDLARTDQKVAAEKTHANATDSFKGNKLDPGASKLDSGKVGDETRGKILDLKDKIETSGNAVQQAGLDIGNTNDVVTKAAGAVEKAKNGLKIVKTDAEIEQLGLDKAQVERDLEQTKADIAAVAESVKAVSAVVKCFTDPDPTNLVGNIFGAIDQGVSAGAAIGENVAISNANTKLAAIDGTISKLNGTKKTLNVTNAGIEIDAAKTDVRIARRDVQKAVLAYKSAVIAQRELYRQLSDEMKKAGKSSKMGEADQKKLAAAVEAIPKMKSIIQFCVGLQGHLRAPAYNQASGIGCAMSSDCGTFQQNVGIIKGTDAYIGETRTTWEGRLASVEAAISSATAV